MSDEDDKKQLAERGEKAVDKDKEFTKDARPADPPDLSVWEPDDDYSGRN
jgi:hypothetical protein